MADYEDIWWSSADGLKLHARDYPGDAARPALLCMPGLTRNARDYGDLAGRLSAQGWRTIVVEFRGRGRSEYAKDPLSYVPATYVADVIRLLDEQAIGRCAAIGTSLGGLVAMLLAAALPGRLVGALLNDVGPEIEAAGLARIRGYVGRSSNFPTWMHAARQLADSNGDVYPDWRIEDWLGMAKRLYRLNSAGRVVLDYDMKIAEPFRVVDGAPAPDMWPVLDALGDAPVLVVRGGRSDVLGADTAAKMVARLPAAELATVPGVGHAPTLAEPSLRGPIDRWLARVAEPVPA